MTTEPLLFLPIQIPYFSIIVRQKKSLEEDEFCSPFKFQYIPDTKHRRDHVICCIEFGRSG